MWCEGLIGEKSLRTKFQIKRDKYLSKSRTCECSEMGKEKRDFSETSIREIREKFLARALNEMRWRDGERICIVRRDESLRRNKNHNSYSKQSRFLCGWLPQDKTIRTITDGSVLRCVLFTLTEWVIC